MEESSNLTSMLYPTKTLRILSESQYRHGLHVITQLLSISYTYICLQMVFGSMAIFGNVMNIVIFSKPQMRTPINLLCLAMESVNIVIILCIAQDWFLYFFEGYTMAKANVVIRLVLVNMTNVAIFASNWLTVTIGIFRYVAVRWPIHSKLWCNNSRAKMAICIIMAVSVIRAIPRCFFYVMKQESFSVFYNLTRPGQPVVVETLYYTDWSDQAQENDQLWIKLFDAGNLLHTTVPVLCSIVFTVLLIHSLWMAKSKRSTLNAINSTSESKEHRITVALIAIMLVFIFGYIFSFILTISRYILPLEQILNFWFFYFNQTGITVLMANASTSLFYYYMSVNYRLALKSLFLCGCCRSR